MNKNIKNEVIHFTIRYIYALIISVAIGFAILQGTFAQHTIETKVTAQGEPYTISTSCEDRSHTDRVSVRVDVSNILAKLTRQEADYLRQYFNAQASCGEYPTVQKAIATPLDPVCTTTISAYCGDGNIDSERGEECDSSYGCNEFCKIYNPGPSYIEPLYVAPVYNYEYIAPTGAGDMSIYSGIFK